MSGLNDVLRALNARHVRSGLDDGPFLPRRRQARQRVRGASLPRTLEKTEQANSVKTLYSVGCPRVYVLGTRRKKTDTDHGTHQTPGISDIIAFLPRALGVLFHEVKAKGGRMSDPQIELRDLVELCTAAGLGIYHCVGTYDDLIAWLIGFGLLKSDQVPHYRLPKTAPALVKGVILE